MWRSERRGRTLLSWQAVTDRSKDEEEGAAGLRWLCVTGVGKARWSKGIDCSLVNPLGLRREKGGERWG